MTRSTSHGSLHACAALLWRAAALGVLAVCGVWPHLAMFILTVNGPLHCCQCISVLGFASDGVWKIFLTSFLKNKKALGSINAVATCRELPFQLNLAGEQEATGGSVRSVISLRPKHCKVEHCRHWNHYCGHHWGQVHVRWPGKL